MTVDCQNVKNLVGVDLMLKRIMLHEEAISENPDAPSYEGSEMYLGIPEAAGGAYVVPSLRKHVAEEMGKKAAILKEKAKTGGYCKPTIGKQRRNPY